MGGVWFYRVVVTGTISPKDRELIEQTRQVNKTLSVFVFALQECDAVPTSSLLGITNMLDALADSVRSRATKQVAVTNGVESTLDSTFSRLQIEAGRTKMS